MEISIRQLKANLSAALNEAERGNEVVVSRRGKRIARIVAAGERADERIGTHCLDALRGVDWGGGKPVGLQSASGLKRKQVSDMVIEDRR